MCDIVIYTDGSCNVQKRLGGWGFYTIYKGQEIYRNGGYSGTTISRMEITAVLNALKFLIIEGVENKDIAIISDSTYVTKFVFNDDRIFYKPDTKNYDLRCLLIETKQKLSAKNNNIHIHWIKGHQTKLNDHITGNIIADILSDYKNFDNYEPDTIRLF